MPIDAIFALFCFLVFAAAGAALGQHFRAKAAVGLALGALLGPLGWVLIFFISDGRNSCRQCLQPVAKEASVCPHCTRDLYTSARPLKAAK